MFMGLACNSRSTLDRICFHIVRSKRGVHITQPFSYGAFEFVVDDRNRIRFAVTTCRRSNVSTTESTEKNPCRARRHPYRRVPFRGRRFHRVLKVSGCRRRGAVKKGGRSDLRPPSSFRLCTARP